MKSYNLFNSADVNVSTGHYVVDTTGVLSTNASYNATGFIPVNPGQSYYLSYKHNIAWYNSSQVYISGSPSTTTANAQVAPTGAAFLRCTVAVASWSTFQVTIGTTPLTYQSYGIISGDSISLVAPFISYPSNTYLMQGVENTIYFQAATEKWIPGLFTHAISGGQFISQSNKARVPASATLTAGLLKAVLYDDQFNTAYSAVSYANVGNTSTNNGAITVSVIGDSYTYNGSYLTKVNSLCPALTFVGMRKPYGDTTLKAEGRGGWTLNQYFTQFQSNSSSFTPFMQPADPYKYYGNTDFWAKVYAGSTLYDYAWFDSTGYNSSGFRSSPNTNDMMWDSTNGYLVVWNGSSWTTTGVTTASFTFNYTKYRSVFGIAKPDVLVIQLGLNDFRNLTSKSAVTTAFSTWQTQLNTLITSVHADNANCKIVLLLPPSFIGSMDNDGGNNTLMQNYMMWQARNLMIDNLDNMQGFGVYLVDTGSAIDPDYGFAFNTELPFNYYHYNTQELRNVTTNSPHPSTVGYYQMGVPLAAFIQYTR